MVEGYRRSLILEVELIQVGMRRAISDKSSWATNSGTFVKLVVGWPVHVAQLRSVQVGDDDHVFGS